MPMEMEICADDANGIAKTKNANSAKRMLRMICICGPSCPLILRLPDNALPLRVARMKRKPSGTNRECASRIPVSDLNAALRIMLLGGELYRLSPLILHGVTGVETCGKRNLSQPC